MCAHMLNAKIAFNSLFSFQAALSNVVRIIIWLFVLWSFCLLRILHPYQTLYSIVSIRLRFLSRHHISHLPNAYSLTMLQLSPGLFLRHLLGLLVLFLCVHFNGLKWLAASRTKSRQIKKMPVLILSLAVFATSNWNSNATHLSYLHLFGVYVVRAYIVHLLVYKRFCLSIILETERAFGVSEQKTMKILSGKRYWHWL